VRVSCFLFCHPSIVQSHHIFFFCFIMMLLHTTRSKLKLNHSHLPYTPRIRTTSKKKKTAKNRSKLNDGEPSSSVTSSFGNPRIIFDTLRFFYHGIPSGNWKVHMTKKLLVCIFATFLYMPLNSVLHLFDGTYFGKTKKQIISRWLTTCIPYCSRINGGNFSERIANLLC
jgi:hypothetical protein